MSVGFGYGALTSEQPSFRPQRLHGLDRGGAHLPAKRGMKNELDDVAAIGAERHPNTDSLVRCATV